MLFEGGGYGGFPRSREAGEPDRGAFLFAELGAFGASEACVPGDVAVVVGSDEVRSCEHVVGNNVWIVRRDGIWEMILNKYYLRCHVEIVYKCEI